MSESNVEQQNTSDYLYGKEEWEKEMQLEESRKVSGWINLSGVVLAVLLYIFPFFSSLWLILGALFPIVVIIVVFNTKGAIKLQSSKYSREPTITIGCMTATLGFFIRTDRIGELGPDSWLMEYSPLLSLPLFFIFLLATSELRSITKHKIFMYLGALLFCLMYGFSLLKLVNCLPDTSEIEVHQTIIQQKNSKKVHKGKNYYFLLHPWGPYENMQYKSVRSNLYSEGQEGDTLQLVLKEGFLGVSWYKMKVL